jgi:AcrR family transcriptional regulator
LAKARKTAVSKVKARTSRGLQRYREDLAVSKRRKILESAATLFVRHGFERTAMADVIRLSGVSSATVYKHYGTKTELFSAVSEQLVRDLLPALHLRFDRRTALADNLRSYGLWYARLITDPKAFELVRILISEAKLFPELSRSYFEYARGPLVEPLKKLLLEAVPGYFSETLKVGVAVRQYCGLIEAGLVWLPLFQPGEKISREYLLQVVSEATKTFLARFKP